jgi:hypothetical protein
VKLIFDTKLLRLVVLITFLTILSILSRTGVPWFLKLMISLSSQVKFDFIRKQCTFLSNLSFDLVEHSYQQSYVLVALHVTQTNELYQLAAVAFCLLFAWVSFYCSYIGML